MGKCINQFKNLLKVKRSSFLKVKRHRPDVGVQQFFEKESSTYSYLLYDQETGDGIFIDPVYETYERDLKWIKDLGIKLLYILETHVHADHKTGSWEIKKATEAKTCLSATSGVKNADLLLDDGQTIEFGNFSLKAFNTPGHTNGCMSYYVDGMLFTGDALFIRGCGRTDFQEGDPHTLFKSVRDLLFSYPDETLIYPGHDYKGVSFSTVGEEKKFNPRLKLDHSEEDFVKIMNGLNLAYPKKIDVSLPHNLVCGKEN
tara:strand:- start:3589 stop:4362 length:774 start_codon:yes stop_codon:yes gene_type:complete